MPSSIDPNNEFRFGSLGGAQDPLLPLAPDYCLPPIHIVCGAAATQTDLQTLKTLVWTICNDIIIRRPPAAVIYLLYRDSRIYFPRHPQISYVQLLAPPEIVASIIGASIADDFPIIYTLAISNSQLEAFWLAKIATIPIKSSGINTELRPTASQQFARLPATVVTSNEVVSTNIYEQCIPRIRLRTGLMKHAGIGAHQRNRVELCRLLCIDPDSYILGMIGPRTNDKCYELAFSVIAQIRTCRPILVLLLDSTVVGSHQYERLVALIDKHDIKRHVLLAPPINNMYLYYSGIDTYICPNLATRVDTHALRARLYGVPVVAPESPFQKDFARFPDQLLKRNAGVHEYAEACKLARNEAHTHLCDRNGILTVESHLWMWLPRYGFMQERATNLRATLFVTNHLRNGGAQRSLINLLTTDKRANFLVATIDRKASSANFDALVAAKRPVFCVGAGDAITDTIASLLHIIYSNEIKTVCFWNLTAQIKLILTRTLQHTPIRFVDVSPGPQLFAGLERWSSNERAIGGYQQEDYFARLDHFVAKYSGGVPRAHIANSRMTVSVIPNGVAYVRPRRSHTTARVRPLGVDPDLAVVSCCRIVPAKLVEQQLLVARVLADHVPGATLTIVGESDVENSRDYGLRLAKLYRKLRLTGIVHFVGGNSDSLGFLHEFRVFFMLSHKQGCPNASLEAMACGLPVVANPDGGTGEQVINGETGFLVSEFDVPLICDRLEFLLRNRSIADKMGDAGRSRVRKYFSLDRMVSAYSRVIQDI